jgi:hypothetical protein
MPADQDCRAKAQKSHGIWRTVFLVQLDERLIKRNLEASISNAGVDGAEGHGHAADPILQIAPDNMTSAKHSRGAENMFGAQSRPGIGGIARISGGRLAAWVKQPL